jgi:hypothetical protein
MPAAITERRKCFALCGVVLAAVLGEPRCAGAIDDRSEESSGADGWQLFGVADEDQFAVGALDLVEQPCECASVGHACLVDDHSHARRQAAIA